MTKGLDEVHQFIDNLIGCNSLSTILAVIFVCLICTILVLLSNLCSYKLFNKDLLGLGGFEITKWTLWSMGSIVTYLLLYLMGIMNYTVQSIIIVAFTWNILLESTVKKLKDSAMIDIKKSVEALKQDSDDFATVLPDSKP